MMTVLYAVIPLWVVNVWLPLGAWYGRILLIVFVALAVSLSVFSAFETRSLQKLAREL